MKLRRNDIEWMLPLLVLVILAYSMVVLYTATRSLDPSLFNRQLIYIGVAFALFIGAALLPERLTFTFSYIFYTLVLMLLLLVLFVGTGPTGRWLGMGSFHIQPSELAKLAIVLALARFLSDKQADLRSAKNILYLVVMAGVPFLLVVIEPDLGTSVVLLVVAGGIAFWAGLPLLAMVLALSPLMVMLASINPYTLVAAIGLLILFAYFTGISLPVGVAWGTIVGLIGAATPRIINQLKPYQRERLTGFLNPEADPLGSGYQLIQSKVAIGSGRFWGKGFLEGSQTQGGFLPAQHTDFIFSVIGEEFGFVGTSLLLFLFWLLVLRLILLARKVNSSFASMVMVGMATIIAFQVIINVGMTTGIMPVTGLPLPLVSYGGSSMITMMLGLGLCMGMGSRWRRGG